MRATVRSLGAALVLTLAGSPAVALIEQSDDLIAELNRLRSLSFEDDSDLYDPPSSSERSAFTALAQSLAAFDFPTADAQAAALDYELVHFTDTVSGNDYYLLREELVNGSPTRGWGSYIINPAAQRDVLIEAPHTLFELATTEIAGRVFRESGAFGFLMNGAHRNANGEDTADPAELERSIFHRVHRAWTDPVAQRTAIQVHGWNNDNDRHDDFPSNARIVVSNGDGDIDANAIIVDAAFDALGLTSYVYNELDPDDPLNVLVNGLIDGDTFDTLAATQNVQGEYSRSIGASFLHVEIELGIRKTQSGIDLSVLALTDAVAALPEPGAASLLAALGLLAPRRRRIRR